MNFFKGKQMYKSEIFEQAMESRVKVRFYYDLHEEIIDPYFIFTEEDGTKALYGKSNGDKKVMKYDFERIINIRVLKNEHFIPIIPLSTLIN